MNIQKRKLVITGNDSDSGTISVLAKLAFGESVDIVHTGNSSDADSTIRRELLEYQGFKKYSEIFITKIAFKDNDIVTVIKDLLNLFPEFKITYVNHQKINLYLKDEPWARIMTSINGVNIMSADIFYKILKEEHNFIGNDWVDNLVETSRQYGTYEWRVSNDLAPKRFNDFYFSKLPKDFLYNMLEKYYMKSELISINEMEAIIKSEDDYKELLAQKKNEVEIKRLLIDDIVFRVAFVSADSYISELGYDIATQIPNIDATAIITSSSDKIRFRRGANKDNIDVSVIAKAFGGNGNPAAAGCRITPEIQKLLKSTLMKTLLDNYNIKIV